MEVAGISEIFVYCHPLHLKYLVERILFPVVGVVYSAISTLQAQFSHFWTDRPVYAVSAKPAMAHKV